MRTCSSAGSRRAARAGSSSTARRPQRALDEIDPQSVDRDSRTRKCCTHCASYPSSGDTTRATSRSSRSAAPGPLHACALADELGCERCSFPPPRAYCPPSASSWATSGATTCARSSARSPTPASCRARERRASATSGSRSSSQCLWAELEQRFHRAHEDRYGYANRERSSSWSPCVAPTLCPGPRSTSRGRPRKRRGAGARGARRFKVLGPRGLDRQDQRARRPSYSPGVMDIELQVTARLAGGGGGDGCSAHTQFVLVKYQGAARLLDGPFRRRGRMIAQAEHIPVHLGRCRKPSRRSWRRAAKRRGLATERPVRGGTHLPDITMVSRPPLGYAVTAHTMPMSAAWNRGACRRSRRSCSRKGS